MEDEMTYLTKPSEAGLHEVVPGTFHVDGLSFAVLFQNYLEVKDHVSKLELTSQGHKLQLEELKLKEAEIKKQLIELIEKLEAQVKENTLALKGRAAENETESGVVSPRPLPKSDDIFKRLAALEKQVQDNTQACKVASQLTEKAEKQLKKEAGEHFKKLETQIAEIQTMQKELKDSSESKLKAMKNELEKYIDEKFNQLSAQIPSGLEIDSINLPRRYLSKSTSNLSDSGLEKTDSSQQRTRSSENLLSDDRDSRLLNKSKLQPRDTSTPRKDALSPSIKQKTKTK
ncbi:PREDICTED: uncharacterized protein LOC109583000 [Amphimedon queenslandica]|uniref:Uncharacterized protein n=1 Tax=Amphimedon queenslandica TaxID=400682 RepID=A0A1X7UKS8_AMPQE|nr:PREDICTED: uncharacterized protein LOC109583000 [Amphimedon queenslandica]|eukprot:XP_019853679.1 PREDICTED: uncharacterized protein LOC109583000 [Amphimedon queenslandica]